MFTELHINDARASDSGFDDDHSGVFVDNFADDRRIFAVFVLTHLFEHFGGALARQNRQQFSFIGDVKRIESEQFAGGANNRRDGNFVFLQHNSNVRRFGDFVE